MIEAISQFLNYGFYILIVIGIAVAVSFFNYYRQKSFGLKYLNEYPNAAKVFLGSKGFIVSETITVFSVNDEPPAFFTEKNKLGFYVKPGSNKIQVDYTHNRPGVIYKNVSTSTGFIDIEIEVEQDKSYNLFFDRELETFTFKEI